MVFEKRGKYCFRDENGRLFKFKTEEEAAKAAGLGVEWEFDHGSKEEVCEEKDSDKAPSHYDWLQEEENLDSEE